jgi:VanZ family protein
VAAWSVVIFSFSTETFSSEHTQGVVVDILRTLLPYLSESTLLILHEVIRKCGHVVEYFIFGVLLFRAIRAPLVGWNLRWAILAILIATFFSSSDEIHQIFVPSRGASIWDALLDTGAASVAQFVVWIFNRREQSSLDQQEFRSRTS